MKCLKLSLPKTLKPEWGCWHLHEEQKLEGENDIAEFILNRGSKVVAEVLETAWEMEGAQETLEQQTKVE